jgi:hypothetical protein
VVRDGLRAGDSVAVDGCCLTAVRLSPDGFECELTQETLTRTSFGVKIAVGERVNLERPLAAAGRFDGHIVQGHVDGVGRVIALRRLEHSAELEVAPPPSLERYLVEKGSIAVDGVSRGGPGQPRGGRDRQVRGAPADDARKRVKPKETSPFSPIPEAVADIREGRMVVVVDDEDRETEGDLTIAAQHVTPDVINLWPPTGGGWSACP